MSENILIPALIAFGLVNVAALFIILVLHRKYKKARDEVGHYGDRAEHLVQEYIHEHFPDAFLLNNLYFATDYGLTQIDHILICRQGVYIIETKSHNGHINVGERNWTQHYKDKNISFHSPIRQNAVHLKALKRVLSADPVFSRYKIGTVVVFTSKNVSFSQNVHGVIRLNRLADFIRRNPQSRSRDKGHRGMRLSTMKKLKDHIVSSAEKSTRKHERHKQEIHNQYSETP